MKKSLVFGFTSLVFLGFAASAYAQTPAAATPITNEEPEYAEFPPAECQPGYWELRGAGFLTNQKTAFNPKWVPVLENIAVCLSHPGMIQACVSVQGRFDSKPFASQIIAAFGSQRAAQEARAQSRSSRVYNELLKMGVPSIKILQEPLGYEATFRGVAVVLESECSSPLTVSFADEGRMESAVMDAVNKRVEELAEKVQAQTKTPEQVLDHNEMLAAMVSDAVAEAVEQKLESSSKRSSHLWIDAQLMFSLLTGEPNLVFAPVLALGGGWSNELLYAHLDLGFDVATAEEQRIGLEVSGAVGYVFQRLSWLELGAIVGNRVGTTSPSNPWLENIWYAGAESSQCLFELGDKNEICIQESLTYGRRYRRGQVNDDGVLERIEGETTAMMRFDLALVARHDFL